MSAPPVCPVDRPLPPSSCRRSKPESSPAHSNATSTPSHGSQPIVRKIKHFGSPVGPSKEHRASCEQQEKRPRDEAGTVIPRSRRCEARRSLVIVFAAARSSGYRVRDDGLVRSCNDQNIPQAVDRHDDLLIRARRRFRDGAGRAHCQIRDRSGRALSRASGDSNGPLCSLVAAHPQFGCPLRADAVSDELLGDRE